jgi:GntR family transcriptional repressor for pyruvate dehydrogenase complex
MNAFGQEGVMRDHFDKLTLPNNLSAKSIDAIIGLIRSGKLKHGEKLPAQDELARVLGISRTSLREALKELSYRGIIVSRHGHGTFVADNMITEKDTVEARRLLEPGIAMMAALRRDDDDVEELRRLVDRMIPLVAAKEYEKFSELDMEFHCAIAGMCGNQALMRLYNAVRDIMLHQQNIVQRLDGAINRAHVYHVEIVKALADRDAGRAQRMMTNHLDDVNMTLHIIEGEA